MDAPIRREITLRGRVQGVGLRPWLARRAAALGLAGRVRNTRSGVEATLEGRADAVDDCMAALRSELPGAARIESIDVVEASPRGELGFRIEASALSSRAGSTRIPLDRPICDDCLAELFDPHDRRYRYAFTHCAECGPRASILRALPFDRAATSMQAFAPCDSCVAEYTDPSDRRLHAQTIACPSCGPCLEALDAHGAPLSGDAVERAADCLRAGGIVASKGYGGYHLLCDATRTDAVARLRERKQRPTRPLAVMVADEATARALIAFGPAERAWLTGSERAVVVAPRIEPAATDGPTVTAAVAPRTHELGVLLPFAPVHWLLLYGPDARPRDAPARFGALVFTSANRSGEPTVHDDDDALARLGPLCDLVLGHDRDVVRPSDDPVVRASTNHPIPIRLSRSTAPRVLGLPGRVVGEAVVLAVGGDIKAAPALLARDEIVLGEHVGDLAHVESADALEERAHDLCELVGASPDVVAHDLHPDYAGAAIAGELATTYGARTVAVGHHHAHAVSCLVENDHPGPALALVLDGGGFGPDESVWGGELLRIDFESATRLAHLEDVVLAGGDAAVREPWRMAWAWTRCAFPAGDDPSLPWRARRSDADLAVLARAAERSVAGPPTSSCGRLFAAVACLLELGDHATHEGELEATLEALAHEAGRASVGLASGAAEADHDRDHDGVIAVGDLVRFVIEARIAGVDRASLARHFHLSLADRLSAATRAAARRTGLGDVALSGGCFQNRLLSEAIVERLEVAGLRVLTHRRVPPNDGGLAVGQTAVARAIVSRMG